MYVKANEICDEIYFPSFLRKVLSAFLFRFKLFLIKFVDSNSPCKDLCFPCGCNVAQKPLYLPSEVVVSSDKRSYRNLTFHNVLARQGSSYCNRACLILQAFALCDMTMVTREGCHHVCVPPKGTNMTSSCKAL